MPIGDVVQQPFVNSPLRQTDWLARCVRLVLFLLVSPALLLVLVVGAFLLVGQFASRGWNWLSAIFRPDRPIRPTDRVEPAVLITAKGPASARPVSQVHRRRPA